MNRHTRCAAFACTLFAVSVLQLIGVGDQLHGTNRGAMLWWNTEHRSEPVAATCFKLGGDGETTVPLRYMVLEV